jgi:Ca2+-binding EF-hand superfamily protein
MAEMVASADASFSMDPSSFSDDDLNQMSELFSQAGNLLSSDWLSLIFPCYSDTNQDGSISVRELKDMFVSLGYNISRKILRRLIRIVDKDRSGSLSFDEFLSLVVLVSTALEKEANNVPDETYAVDFSQFTADDLQQFQSIFNDVGLFLSPSLPPCLLLFCPDTNGDGTVSIPELKAMFVSLNYQLTDERILELVASVDSDRSGNLCFEEFVALVIIVNQSNEAQQTGEAEMNASQKYGVDCSQFTEDEVQGFWNMFQSVGGSLPPLPALSPAHCSLSLSFSLLSLGRCEWRWHGVHQ